LNKGQFCIDNLLENTFVYTRTLIQHAIVDGSFFFMRRGERESIHSFIHLSMIRLHKIIISMLKKDAWKV